MCEDKVLIFGSRTTLPPTIVLVLSQAGYEVDIAEDHIEGLQAIASNDYQLVIVREGAIGTARLVCLQIRQLTSIPIIVISCDPSEQALVRTINAGADYFLRVPVSSLVLVARINALLRRTRLAPFCQAS